MTTHADRPPPGRRLPKMVRVLRTRPRLLASAGIGLLSSLALALTEALTRTEGLTLIESLALRPFLVGWDVGVVLYLGLALHLAAQANQDHIRRQARLQDEGRIFMLVLTASGAFLSLAAIFALLGETKAGARAPFHLVLALSTVALSWALTHTIFGLHYAHEYYGERGGKGVGLEFPGKGGEPDYWDFFYFSFVIGMCAQVSDITVSSQTIRRTVFAHSVVSFVFNVALLALVVNVAASALAPGGTCCN
jgi:uncharacterized membrane protein